ncbi:MULTISPECIES: Zn-ribbon domain-containing OB-fold protein [unclassified Frankia]|uniref:Zn-ribbon domain-containing OB-fold protein n=1 Tax=unclassified Frankia TaxID=2632575 RepID=UPI002AD59B01|nr:MULTISPECIES: Zn-ribbon domain-containing OB-fold protein [unclassified Frankia]
MTVHLRALATHLPAWGTVQIRLGGPDEDAVTLAVAAGRAALAAAVATGQACGVDRAGPTDSAGAADTAGEAGWADLVERVVLVTRDVPLLEGGSTAVLLAGLDLPDSVPAVQILGGAPAALDAVTGAQPGTLVIGVDVAGAAGAGAGAALVGDAGTALRPLARCDRSLPVLVRDDHGRVSDYADARLLRDRGLHANLARLALPGRPIAVAGLTGNEAKAVTAGGAGSTPAPTTGASAVFFALAGVIGQAEAGPLLAVEQATLVAAAVEPAPATATAATAAPQTQTQTQTAAQAPAPTRTALAVHAPAPRALPVRRMSSEAQIAISLPAYERAFDAKVRLRAGRCGTCGTLSLPPRSRCLECGMEGSPELVALPREATVYSAVTINVPVPGLATPYSLALVELGDSGVRLLTHVTDAEPGAVAIGDRGRVLLRRVAIRSGVPDYGYAFAPSKPTPEPEPEPEPAAAETSVPLPVPATLTFTSSAGPVSRGVQG